MRLRRRAPRLSKQAKRRLAEHQGRAGDILDVIRREYADALGSPGKPWDTPAAQPLAHDDELALSTLIVIVASDDFVTWNGVSAGYDYMDGVVRDDLRARILRRKLSYARADVDLLTSLAEWKGTAWWLDLARCRVAVAALEHYARDHAPRDISAYVDQLKKIVGGQDASSDWTSLGVRLQRLAPPAEALDLSVLAAKDPWTKKVRPVVARDYADCGALLSHLASATASRPSKKWLDQAGTLLGGNGDALVRYLLEATFDVDSEEVGRAVWEGRSTSTCSGSATRAPRSSADACGRPRT